MRRTLGKLAIAGAAVVAAFALIGLVVGPQSPQPTAAATPTPAPTAATEPGRTPTPAPLTRPAPTPDLELVGVPQGIESPTGMEIVGRVRNNRATAYRYAQVLFAVSNPQGEQIGTAMANIANLEAGAIWKFRAVFITPQGARASAPASRFRLTEVSGW